MTLYTLEFLCTNQVGGGAGVVVEGELRGLDRWIFRCIGNALPGKVG
jgi:hypothetical protein